MDWFFITMLGLVLFFLFIVLGKYSLSGEIEKGEDHVSCLLNVRSRCRLLGIEWIRSASCNQFHFVLFGRKIPRPRKKADLPRHTIRSGFGSGRMPSRPSVVSVRRLFVRVIRLFHRFDLVRLSLSGTAGLGDPAATGMAFGLLQSLQFAIPGKITLDVEPDFTRRRLEGKGSVHLYFCFITVLVFLFRLGWEYLRIRKSSYPARIRTGFA